MKSFLNALRGGKKGDNILIVEYDELTDKWYPFVEIELVTLLSYPTRLEYKHAGVDGYNYVNVENMMINGTTAVLSERTLPDEILFQCKLSQNYVEAVKYYGYETYETA